MFKTTIEKKLINILEDMTGIDAMLQDKLFQDLELNYFDFPEMGANIEEIFGIEVTDKDLDEFNPDTTVNDVVTYIENKLAVQQPVKHN